MQCNDNVLILILELYGTRKVISISILFMIFFENRRLQNYFMGKSIFKRNGPILERSIGKARSFDVQRTGVCAKLI